ncbi:MAG: HlyD family type I secretion periplasmic adaptor subunit [Robiginitomaculum sp.]
MTPNTAQTLAAPKRSYDRYLKIGGFAITGLFAFLLVAMFMPIQGAVVAAGTIVVEGRPKVLQHLDGGIVGEIFVADGDVVKAGDIMMRLDTTALSANRDLISNRLLESQTLRGRLLAERDNAQAINWDSLFKADEITPKLQQRMNDQDGLFLTRRKARNGMASQLRSRIFQRQDQIKGLKALIASKQEQLALTHKQLAGQRILVERNVIKDVYSSIITLEREQASLNGDIANYNSEIARTRNAISETQIEIAQAERNFQEKVLTELRSTESQISDLKEQLITANDQTARIDIKSPVDGIVHNMTVTTVGGVITPANPIMEIIPSDTALIVEAQVAPSDIDQIYVGQETNVRLSAFNTRTTPELTGRVISTSANTVIDSVTGFAFYTVKIHIPSEELARLNGLKLIPGMPAEGYMQTEKRSIWNYLIKPATDQLSHALREE